MILIEKFDPRKIMTAVFWDAKQGYVYLKRFSLDISDRKISFIGDHPDNKLLAYSLDYLPVLEVKFDEKANGRPIEDMILKTGDFVGLKSFKAKGKRLSTNTIKSVRFLEPLPYGLPEEVATEESSEEESSSRATEDKPVASSKKKKNEKGSSSDKGSEDKPATSRKKPATKKETFSEKTLKDKKDKPSKEDGQITLDL
jgi:topoisomerase-4 subunit A